MIEARTGVDVTEGKRIQLGDLKKGTRARITQVGRECDDSATVSRLLEMGFLEGAWIEVVHEAPFGGDPIAIRVRGTLLALRRNEANAVEVSIHE
jgi:ferrous iron transport protein A